jgi:GINS complex subunit 2
MSGLTLKSVTAAENEFLAEETIITITSNIDHPEFKFISGVFGPLEASYPCKVPLWLAITLRKRGKCTVVIPDWMSRALLEQNIDNEKNLDLFEPLPFHYKEISQLLLNNARDDFPDPDRVAALLHDIENIRLDRAKIGIIGNFPLTLALILTLTLTLIRSQRNYWQLSTLMIT